MKAFQVMVDGKPADYRLGEALDLAKIKVFFEKEYTVKKIWQAGRHILGSLEKNDKSLFLKLATTVGISELTKIEHEWNDQFNTLSPRATTPFWVPQNISSGMYGNLFYLITDTLEGPLLAKRPDKNSDLNLLIKNIPAVAEFAQIIQTLPITKLSEREGLSHLEFFIQKTNSWFDDIPEQIRGQYGVGELLDFVTKQYKSLEPKPRHGDFTPWHILELTNGTLGLIDGEHAVANGVEHYDVAYFIQRVFSVLQDQKLASDVTSLVLEDGTRRDALKTILAARAIGGFLDASLAPDPDYNPHQAFKGFALSL